LFQGKIKAVVEAMLRAKSLPYPARKAAHRQTDGIDLKASEQLV